MLLDNKYIFQGFSFTAIFMGISLIFENGGLRVWRQYATFYEFKNCLSRIFISILVSWDTRWNWKVIFHILVIFKLIEKVKKCSDIFFSSEFSFVFNSFQHFFVKLSGMHIYFEKKHPVDFWLHPLGMMVALQKYTRCQFENFLSQIFPSST